MGKEKPWAEYLLFMSTVLGWEWRVGELQFVQLRISLSTSDPGYPLPALSVVLWPRVPFWHGDIHFGHRIHFSGVCSCMQLCVVTGGWAG